jgi:hypothetical protein
MPSDDQVKQPLQSAIEKRPGSRSSVRKMPVAHNARPKKIRVLRALTG